MKNNNFKYMAFILLIVGCSYYSRADISAARAEVAGSIIRKEYKNENREVVIDIGKNTLALPENCIIDVETGSGHGGYLDFIRLKVNGETVSIEKVMLQHSTILLREPKEICKVKRVVTERKEISDILESVMILPAIKLSEKSTVDTRGKEVNNKDGTITISADISGWGSSSDFFTLVRVLDGNRKKLIEKEYAGYYGSTDQLKYLPISAVCIIVKDCLDKIDRWNEVPSNELRDCHLSDAFNLNRDFLIKNFHWWVLENSVEGLAQAGNKSVLEAIKFILAKYSDRTERIAKKINAISTDYDYWLSGTPKDLSTIEQRKN